MDLNISKAKLTKKGCLEVVYADKEGNDIVFKGINPVHPDLKDSLNKLIPYIVDITEMEVSKKKLFQKKTFENIWWLR